MNSILTNWFFCGTSKKIDRKGLFNKIIDTMLYKGKDLPLTPHESANELAE